MHFGLETRSRPVSTKKEGDKMGTPQFQPADLIPRLISEYGYSSHGAADIAAMLVACTPRVRELFWQWWQTGDMDDSLEIEGYTVARMVSKYGFKPPAAFTMLDLLQREPERALAVLNRRHDKPIFRKPSTN
jgi:hypothetical protein